MNAPSVRLATLDDQPAVAALFDAYRQFYEQPADAALALEFIGNRMRNRESVILVAEPEGAPGAGPLIGFCQLYPGFCSVVAQPIYTLYDLYVAPAARKSGAGRALMQAAHAHAKATRLCAPGPDHRQNQPHRASLVRIARMGSRRRFPGVQQGVSAP
jgi:ribosomal protein S18 acetylase RimI-like enzyme